MKIFATIGLLTVSNIFMTLAWYGHLKFKELGWFANWGIFAIILLSWGIALFEYCFQVPANRIGFEGNGGPFSLWQLKVIQEVITLTVFTVFTLVVFRNESFRMNHLIGFVFLVLAVYFIFKNSWKLKTYNMKTLRFDDLDNAKNSDGLVPAIIQDDATLKVLMLGYMDREAFDKTVASGQVTFYSRTKRRLWTKGETSGNFMEVVSLSADCDADTLLVRVRPHGPACHNGTISCFTEAVTPEGTALTSNDNEGFIRQLHRVIAERHRTMPEGSYTTKLFTKGVNKIAQKVGEEAVETVIDAVAGNRDGFLYEASDLVYHLLVLMEEMNVTPADMERELASRHK